MVGRPGDLENPEKADVEGSVKCKEDSRIIRPEECTLDVATWKSLCASSDSNSSRHEEGKAKLDFSGMGRNE